MKQPLGGGLNSIKLNIRESAKKFGKCQLEVSRKKRRAISNCQPAMGAVAYIPNGGLKVVGVSN